MITLAMPTPEWASLVFGASFVGALVTCLLWRLLGVGR